MRILHSASLGDDRTDAPDRGAYGFNVAAPDIASEPTTKSALNVEELPF